MSSVRSYALLFLCCLLTGCGLYGQPQHEKGTAASSSSVPTSEAQGGFPIVQDGQAKVTVVLPAQPKPVEVYAARELVEHVEKVSGVKLRIENEAKDGTLPGGAGPSISIGATRKFLEAIQKGTVTFKEWQDVSRYEALSRTSPGKTGSSQMTQFPVNGYLVHTNGNSLFLVGHDGDGDPLNDAVSAGTLFAAYEWLERQLGIRWIWPGELGTHLPRASHVISGQWAIQSQPPVLSSQMTRTIGSSLFSNAIGGYTAEQRKQVVQAETVWYRRNRFARGVNFHYGGHAFEEYWDRFGTTHPEYFNLLPDGKRRAWIHPRVISMSVANLGFQNQVIEDWKKSRSAERPWINATENDTAGLCVCSECMAWDVPDPNLKVPWEQRLEHARRAFEKSDRLWYENLGRMSDRYARYLLELQRLGKETDPKATTIAYAYLNYRHPPIATKLNSNIIIGIIPEAPAPLSYLWPLSEKNYGDFEKQWVGWDKTGASLFLRPNYTLSGHEQPLLFPRQIARYFQLAHRHGLVATNYDSLTSMWSTQGPNLYVAARLHWRPDWPVEKILDEYYGLFGPAAKDVRAYFEFWEKHSETRAEELVRKIEGPYQQHTRDLFLKWAHFYRVASLVFTPADYTVAERHLSAARAAAKGDEAALRRVAFLEAGLKDAQLVSQASAIELELEKTGDTDSMSRIVTAIDDHRNKIISEFPHALNFDLAAFNENRSWDRPVYRAMAQAYGAQKLSESWTLRWDPEKKGVQEQWYKQPGERTAWQTIGINKVWEKQEAGRRWKEQHQADYDGWAWYQTSFKADPARRGQRLFLLFGAVDESATVYLNGREVGQRVFAKSDDWRTPFFVEVTNDLKFDGDNQLTVLVEDKSGEGGIWKPVWLVERKDG